MFSDNKHFISFSTVLIFNPELFVIPLSQLSYVLIIIMSQRILAAWALKGNNSQQILHSYKELFLIK